MARLREWLVRLWGTLSSRRTDQDWTDELGLHVALAAEEAQRRGAAPDAALRSVRLQAGSVTHGVEALRDQHGMPWLHDLARDVRHALRSLRRSPGFTTVAVLTLALGIGANSAIFSVVHAVLLRPLPYDQPDRLVAAGAMLAGEYLVLRDHAQSLSAMALYQPQVGLNLSVGNDADRVMGAYASANLFATLGVHALIGRTFHEDEERFGAVGVIVLSHALWQQRFAADPSIVGRDLLIDGAPRRVIGVMASTFNFPSVTTQLWLPYAFNRGDAAGGWGGAQRGFAIARLAPGASQAQAQAEVRARAPELRTANTLWVLPAGWGLDREVVPLHHRLVGDVRTRLLVVLGAVGFVLLIACANVANLLLARSSARQREVAIRGALGAGRSRMIRQLLTESAVLGLVGGAAGLLLAFWGVRVLAAALAADLPRAEEVAIDGWVLGFTLLTSVLTGLAFGVLPALRASRADVQGCLKADQRGASASFSRAAGLLIIGEVAVAVVLVIGAGLLLRSLAELLRVDPGFQSQHLVTARITPPRARDDGHRTTQPFYDALITHLAALPGVQAVEATSHLPLVGGAGGFAFEVEGAPHVRGTAAPTTGERIVTTGYLRLMGIPLLEGRALADTDLAHGPRVAVINNNMAREHWAGESAIGKRFKRVWNSDWITVVGVVGDVKYSGLASEAEPEIYVPLVQTSAPDMSLVIRSADHTLTAGTSLRAAVAAIDASVPVSEVRTVDQLLARSMAAPRFIALLLGAFAAIALTLAAIGIYGVLSYAVGRRAREIGVRMALGARRVDVLRLVLGHAVLLSGVGALVGIGVAVMATRVLATLLFGVTPTDLVSFAVAPLLLLVVACLAAFVPAHRASRMDPTVALRQE